MRRQRVVSVAWQVCKFLLGLGAWLYMGRHFMGGSGLQGWISGVACAFILLGGLANVVVVILNRGYRPVDARFEIHGRNRLSYEPIHSGTRLWFLGDCISFGESYASPGDLLLFSGCALMILGVALPQLIS